jgi:hypothetical protein
MRQRLDNELVIEPRDMGRPNWLVRQGAFVRRNSVLRSTLVFSTLTVAASTILCHVLYSIFDIPRVGIAIVLPTLAPAVVAPPMIYGLIRAVDLLGRAKNGLQAHRERLQEAVKLARDQARKADIAARAKSNF